MREIKFRGFNHKNNVWIYGFYLQNRGEHFVCPDEFANGKSWEDYEIDPDSLGQFTGLKDKKGADIFEKCELDNKYIVVYKAPSFVGIDIKNNKIINLYNNEHTITKPYCKIS